MAEIESRYGELDYPYDPEDCPTKYEMIGDDEASLTTALRSPTPP